MNRNNKKEAMVYFIKRYGYIIALSVIMFVVSIILIVYANKPVDSGKEPVDNSPITFYNPLLSFTVAKSYNGTNLVYNTTLKQWEAHKGICFTTAENSDVYAAYDGVVEDIYSNYLNGNVVVVSHGNNLKTYYSSLAQNVNVKKGDSIKKGAVIGKASNSRNAELQLGNQLYFEVTENNIKVDPAVYLNLENK